MKIGRMLRDLEVSTRGPGVDYEWNGNEDVPVPVCDFLPARKKENCVCYSSCFLIWITGINRFDSHLGVHRPKFNADYYASLEPDEARKKYNLMIREIGEYLDNYLVPQDLKEMMLMTPSHDIYGFYSGSRKMGGFTPAYDEFLIAKCGVIPSKDDKREWKLRHKKRRGYGEKISETELDELEILKQKSGKNLVCKALNYLVTRVDAYSNYFGIDYAKKLRESN